MTISPEKFIEYCLGVAQEFQARVSRLQVFVKHNLSSGNARETILREFLLAHTAGNYDVGQGFICIPSEDDKTSRQCDILIYNQNDYPLIYSDGPIKVVWPQSVGMVIEVKKNFDKKEIATALENIKSVKELNHRVAGVIFAFSSPELMTVVKNLQDHKGSLNGDSLPDAILILDKGVIIHRWGIARYREIELGASSNAHAVRIGTGKNKGATVVAFLLLMFLDVIGNNDYVTGAKNMTITLIENYTNKGLDDIFIGKH